MNIFEKNLRRLDSFQQRNQPASFIFAVIKKYGDDRAGNLTVLLTYSMFTTVFPLLLLLVTGLTYLLANDPSIRREVLNSTLNQFPIVGGQLGNNIHVLKRDSVFGFIVGFAGLIYGTTGLAGSGMFAMEQIWNIQAALRLNYWTRLARSFVFLGVIGIGLAVTTILTGFGTFGGHSNWMAILAEFIAMLANVGLYFAAFRALTPKQIHSRSLLPGVIFGAVIWTIIQSFGGYIVGHYLRNDNATYGTFGTVLGLLAWIYLGSRLTIYAAEINAVLHRHLWPRSIVQPPLTKADQESIALVAAQNRRLPEQEVITKVKGQPMTQHQYLKEDGVVNQNVIGTDRKVPHKKTSK